MSHVPHILSDVTLFTSVKHRAHREWLAATVKKTTNASYNHVYLVASPANLKKKKRERESESTSASPAHINQPLGFTPHMCSLTAHSNHSHRGYQGRRVLINKFYSLCRHRCLEKLALLAATLLQRLETIMGHFPVQYGKVNTDAV